MTRRKASRLVPLGGLGYAWPIQCVPSHADRSLVARSSDDAFARILEDTRVAGSLPGLAAAVVRGGTIVAKAVAGVRRHGSAEVIQPEDRFHIASCTKSMTASAAIVAVMDHLNGLRGRNALLPLTLYQRLHRPLRAGQEGFTLGWGIRQDKRWGIIHFGAGSGGWFFARGYEGDARNEQDVSPVEQPRPAQPVPNDPTVDTQRQHARHGLPTGDLAKNDEVSFRRSRTELPQNRGRLSSVIRGVVDGVDQHVPTVCRCVCPSRLRNSTASSSLASASSAKKALRSAWTSARA
jgi:Beta-lactamase